MVERGLSIVVGGEGDASGCVGLVVGCWWLKVEKKSNPNAIEHNACQDVFPVEDGQCLTKIVTTQCNRPSRKQNFSEGR